MDSQVSFDAVSFQGAFYDYQSRVLERVRHCKDQQKINVIAAPGSGKTLLGLELIRRHGERALILCQTEADAHHWGEQFLHFFLPDGEKPFADRYISYALHRPALLTCTTYATLSAAVGKQTVTIGGETVDFAADDVFHMVENCGIHTICLDEAHHLSDPWQKGLEMFLGIINKTARTISVSSSAPNDAGITEWNRYISVCGEINDEISVSEMVQRQVLCPHQDYLYFNYPTEHESEKVSILRKAADETILEAIRLPLFRLLSGRLHDQLKESRNYMYEHDEEVVALCILLHEYRFRCARSIYRLFTGQVKIRPLDLPTAQRAFRFLFESRTLLRNDEKEALYRIFEEHGMTENHRPSLMKNEQVRKILSSSLNKLNSVVSIAASEEAEMKDRLRMVILTDYIRKDDFQLVGTDRPFTSIGAVSIFENLRRRCPQLRMACLSGSLLILPEDVQDALRETDRFRENPFTVQRIPGTDYAVFDMSLPRQERIHAVTELLGQGLLQGIVATRAILEENWSAPCINTVILSDVSGSFTATQRLRGRSVRFDARQPDKTTHIWHLVSLEPEYPVEKDTNLRLTARMSDRRTRIVSAEFDMVRRRFACFIGPNEKNGELENGIFRLGLQSKTYTKPIYDQINLYMLNASRNRERLFALWQNAVANRNALPSAECIISKKAKYPVLTLSAWLYMAMGIACIVFGVANLQYLHNVILVSSMSPDLMVVGVVIVTIVIGALIIGAGVFALYIPRIIRHATPLVSVRKICQELFDALVRLELINPQAEMVIKAPDRHADMEVYIRNAPAREQIIFQTAVSEMLSPIENPRYIIVRKSVFKRSLWYWSIACPTIIANNDKDIILLERYIRRAIGMHKFIYTRHNLGRTLMIRARNHSYINRSGIYVKKRTHVNP